MWQYSPDKFNSQWGWFAKLEFTFDSLRRRRRYKLLSVTENVYWSETSPHLLQHCSSLLFTLVIMKLQNVSTTLYYIYTRLQQHWSVEMQSDNVVSSWYCCYLNYEDKCLQNINYMTWIWSFIPKHVHTSEQSEVQVLMEDSQPTWPAAFRRTGNILNTEF